MGRANRKGISKVKQTHLTSYISLVLGTYQAQKAACQHDTDVIPQELFKLRLGLILIQP